LLIDIRQHIVTLVAVFLALAVGLVLGSAFVGGTSMEKHVSKMLEKEFGKLRKENEQKQERVDALTEEIRRHQEFESMVAPYLTEARLARRGVAIIQTGDYDDAVESTRRALESAGAVIHSVTSIHIADDDAEVRAARAVKAITGKTEEDDPINRVVSMLANCISTGGNASAVDIMESEKLISKSGDYTRPAEVIILVGGCKEKSSLLPSSIDSVVIARLKSNGVSTIVGVEPSIVGTSCIRTYQEEGISTVDDIDQPLGKVALVYAILGSTGDFGLRKSAERLVPKDMELDSWMKKYRR